MAHLPLEPLKRLGAFTDGFAGCFGHVAQRDASRLYVAGLISRTERKSMQRIAGLIHLPGSYEALQHFITDSTWPAEGVWTRLRELVPEKRGLLIIDDTSVPKKGIRSVGVKKQYCGVTRRVENCQVAVSTVLRTEAHTWLLAMDLYLPDVWLADRERTRARIPGEVEFRTKSQIALSQIDAAIASGFEPDCVLCDSGYGDSTELRDELEKRKLPFAVAVEARLGAFASELPLAKRGRGQADRIQPQAVREIAKGLPASAWTTVSWRKGSKGRLKAQFAAVRVVPSHNWWASRPKRSQCWLLVERARRGAPMRFFLSSLPESVPLKDLARIAHSRWPIEQNYQQLKEELGVDHFEGRSWPGWNRHVVLSAMAFTFVEQERDQASPRATFPQTRAMLSEIVASRVYAERPDLRAALDYYSRGRGPDPPK